MKIVCEINNGQIQVDSSNSILEACESLGYALPRFCYHSRLQVAGNCRACLVEIENSPKPQASCAMPLRENLSVHTLSPLVEKAQEGVLEFLLLNHPLDCPICDQGGCCDLQDQAKYYGSDRGRMYDFRRGVEDKQWGPFIKTVMTRCIQCTRCVRFASNIEGEGLIGTTQRSGKTEIGTYLVQILRSEVSSNVIDLCPVGKITAVSFQ